MIKSLLDAELRDGVPRVLQKQPWVEALSRAVLDLHRQTMGFIDGSQIYTAIDTVSEAVLDALAVSWKIDWYDPEYDLEQKRRIVQTALTIRRTMGTGSGGWRRPSGSAPTWKRWNTTTRAARPPAGASRPTRAWS